MVRAKKKMKNEKMKYDLCARDFSEALFCDCVRDIYHFFFIFARVYIKPFLGDKEMKRKLSTKQSIVMIKKPGILNLGLDCLLKIFAFLDLEFEQANHLGRCCKLFNIITSSQSFTKLLNPTLIYPFKEKIFNIILKFNNLASLRIDNSFISWETLSTIGSIVGLKQFSLNYCTIDKLSGLLLNEMFENKFSNLESLQLECCRKSLGFLEFMGSTLKMLVILPSVDVQIRDLGQSLSDSHFLPSLESLKLKNVRDETHDMKWLSSCINLVNLDMNCYSWKVLDIISNMSKLEALCLSDRVYGERLLDVNCLSKLIALKTLSLQVTRLKNLCKLSQLNELTTLEIEYTEDFQVPSFRNLSNLIIGRSKHFQLPASINSLTFLQIRHSSVTDDNIKSICTFSNVQTLDFFGSSVLPNQFDISSLVNLVYLNLQLTTEIIEDSFRSMQHLVKLRELTVGIVPNYTNIINGQKRTISKRSCEYLRNIKSLNTLRFTLCDIQDLSRLDNLIELDLQHCASSDLHCLCGFSKLVYLDLRCSRINNSEVLSFKKMKGLRQLGLSGCKIDDGVKEKLKTSHRKLRIF